MRIRIPRSTNKLNVASQPAKVTGQYIRDLAKMALGEDKYSWFLRQIYFLENLPNWALCSIEFDLIYEYSVLRCSC